MNFLLTLDVCQILFKTNHHHSSDQITMLANSAFSANWEDNWDISTIIFVICIVYCINTTFSGDRPIKYSFWLVFSLMCACACHKDAPQKLIYGAWKYQENHLQGI